MVPITNKHGTSVEYSTELVLPTCPGGLARCLLILAGLHHKSGVKANMATVNQKGEQPEGRDVGLSQVHADDDKEFELDICVMGSFWRLLRKEVS